MKEIKARPLDENNKEGKMTAYIFFFLISNLKFFY